MILPNITAMLSIDNIGSIASPIGNDGMYPPAMHPFIKQQYPDACKLDGKILRQYIKQQSKYTTLFYVGECTFNEMKKVFYHNSNNQNPYILTTNKHGSTVTAKIFLLTGVEPTCIAKHEIPAIGDLKAMIIQWSFELDITEISVLGGVSVYNTFVDDYDTVYVTRFNDTMNLDSEQSKLVNPNMYGTNIRPHKTTMAFNGMTYSIYSKTPL